MVLRRPLQVAALALCLICPVAWSTEVAPTSVRVGLLSVLEGQETTSQWATWMQGLQGRLSKHHVEFLPLDLLQMQAAVEQRQIDFLVTNPGQYVDLETRFGAVRMATQTAVDSPNAAHAVGSAVVRLPNSSYKELVDLEGATVAAVSPDAFGGYQVVAAMWKRDDIDVERGDVRMQFTGFPMWKVVEQVLSGEADAGILRACLLERWIQEGKLKQGQFEIVGRHTEGDISCEHSTPVYPGWAFASLPHVNPDLSREVVLALLSLPQEPDGTRWSVPADYQKVHEVLRTLEVGPYLYLRQTRWDALLLKYWPFVASMFLLILMGALYTWRVEVLVKRRTNELHNSLEKQKHLAQQIETDREALEHLSRLSILGEMSATLGHELNHPLATISNYSESLQRRLRAGAVAPNLMQQALESISGQVDRAVRVLGGIRELARKRLGQRKPCVPHDVIKESVMLFRGMQTNPPLINVSIDMRAEKYLWCVDALQIQQVMLNLFKNAQDIHRACGRDECEIDVALTSAQDRLVIRVLDQGDPLSEEQKARLFEPFYTTKKSGLGLGLPICRTIIEAHGGALMAYDREGGGMVFEMTIPIYDATQESC